MKLYEFMIAIDHNDEILIRLVDCDNKRIDTVMSFEWCDIALGNNEVKDYEIIGIKFNVGKDGYKTVELKVISNEEAE